MSQSFSYPFTCIYLLTDEVNVLGFWGFGVNNNNKG